MKRLFTFVLGVLLALAGNTNTFAQTATGPRDLGFAYAVDYGKWNMIVNQSSTTTGAQTMLVVSDGFATTPNQHQFFPLATNAPVIVDIGSGVQETVTPSAVSCGTNTLQATCSFTATFSNVHGPHILARSGTFGIAEAINDITALNTNGGTVLVANGFGGTTSTITSTVVNGSTSVNILDVRNGTFQFYTWNGSNYVASTSPFNSTSAPSATATTAVGAVQFWANQVQTTNHAAAFAATGANTSPSVLDFLKTRSTAAGAPATTTIVTADQLGAVNFWGADGTNYIQSAQIVANSIGTVATTRVPSQLLFRTGTDAAPTVLTTAVTIDQTQQLIPNGGLSAATFNSAANGFANLFADTGSPAAGTTGTNTTGVANQLWYTQIFIPTNMTITNVEVLCGGTCTTDKIAMGLWTTGGTLLAVTSATVGAGATLSGTNTWQKVALTAPFKVSGPGKYIVGVVTSGTNAGDIQTYPLANGPVCAVAGSQGTLATFSPATTGTASSCPYVMVN